MKATCPKSRKHNQFTTSAHVMQDWKVDQNGNFLEVVTECVQVSVEPQSENIWTCTTCGSEAKITN